LDLRPRRFAGFGDRRLATGQMQTPQVIGGRHVPLEHGQRRPVRLYPDDELGTLDHAVDVWRVDRHDPRLAAEGLNGADDQVEDRTLFFLLNDVEQLDGRVLINA
jgi:hypothetical protein